MKYKELAQDKGVLEYTTSTETNLEAVVCDLYPTKPQLGRECICELNPKLCWNALKSGTKIAFIHEVYL